MKYYVVETERQPGAVGYNENGNNTEVLITPIQPTTNMGKKEIDEGWIGTTNNVGSWVHGSFDTLEDAQDYIKTQELLKYFTIDESTYENGVTEQNIVFRDQREWWDVDDWFYETKDELGITAETTDNELQDISIVLEKEIDADNIQIVGDIELYLEHLRATLKI
jgi:chaperone required for assembly of F1-ATPase